MLLMKQGFPDEDELVMCSVTKVQFHSVFVNLDEYGKGGMIHISEVSPGRIRNIRDFVKEGKKVVCKVLKINREKGHIDLSLRRVTETQKRVKVDDIKQQQKAEKILEFVAKDVKLDVKKLFEQVNKSISEKYASMYDFFQKIVSDPKAISDSGLEPKISGKLEEAVKSRIKEASVRIEGKLSLSTYASNGVDIIKECLKIIQDSGKKIDIKYLGAGTYNLIIPAKDYKEAENILERAIGKSSDFINDNDGNLEFVRSEA
jgi:translation initiation factor 2 subunit 1